MILVEYTSLILGFLGVINFVAFAAFGWDKRQARLGRGRISEAQLLGLIAFGGGIGALLGQHRFRHKTRKQPFKAIMWTIIMGQCVLAVGGIAWLYL